MDQERYGYSNQLWECIQIQRRRGSSLENLYPQFEKLFPAIKGKIEVGLKVIGKKEWLEEKVNENPELEKVSASVKGKSEAIGYYERIQLGGMAQKMFTSLQKEVKTDVFSPLEEAAEAKSK